MLYEVITIRGGLLGTGFLRLWVDHDEGAAVSPPAGLFLEFGGRDEILVAPPEDP